MTLQLWLNLQTCADCCKHVLHSICHRCLTYNCIVNEQGKKNIRKLTQSPIRNGKGNKRIFPIMNIFPIGSMYGIYNTYIWLIFMLNVGKYTIPMDPMGLTASQSQSSFWPVTNKQDPETKHETANCWLAVFNHGSPPWPVISQHRSESLLQKAHRNASKVPRHDRHGKHPVFFPQKKFGFGK